MNKNSKNKNSHIEHTLILGDTLNNCRHKETGYERYVNKCLKDALPYIELNQKIKEILICLLPLLALIIINILNNKYMLNVKEDTLISLTNNLVCKISSLGMLLFALIMIYKIIKLVANETIKKYKLLTIEEKEIIKSTVVGLGQGILAFWVLDHFFKK